MTAGRGAIAVSLMIGLSACMGGGRPHGPPPGEERGPPPAPRLFISPAGKPFRPQSDGGDPRQAWFKEADRNGDGGVDRDELVADFTAFFQTLDVDKDGILDGPEVTRYETEVAPEILRRADVGGGQRGGQGGDGGGMRGGPPGGGGEGRGGPPGGGGSGRMISGPPRSAGVRLEGAAQYGLLNDPQPIMSADYDLSRRITLAEFQRKAREIFADLDRDGDGRITAQDLPGPRAGGGKPPRR